MSENDPHHVAVHEAGRAVTRNLMKPSKSDDQLKKSIDVHEKSAELGGVAVFIGLVGEVVLAAFLNREASFIRTWGPVIVDSLVALGVAVEILFSRFARNVSAELQRRSDEKVAAANLKAEEASKEAAASRERTAEIERLTAWRRINIDAQSRIADNIRTKATAVDVLIQYQASDPEAYVYARDLISIFQRAGIAQIRFGANSFLSGNVFGLALSADSDFFIIELAEAFDKEAISHFRMSVNLATILPSNEKAPNLYIFVAPKVPE